MEVNRGKGRRAWTAAREEEDQRSPFTHCCDTGSSAERSSAVHAAHARYGQPAETDGLVGEDDGRVRHVLQEQQKWGDK